MPKLAVLCGFILILISGMFVVLAPDMLSTLFVLATIAVCTVGFVLGVYRTARVNQALVLARKQTQRLLGVQTDDMWLAVRQASRLFGHRELDRTFDRYRSDVEAARHGRLSVLPDVDEYVTEELVSLYTCRGVVLQIPGMLTGIGILGTFVGLVIGVGGVGFSSVAAAINGVETLLAGIELAFYTSIASLSISIVFNFMYRVVWNIMAQNLRRFVLEFQADVVPSAEEQERTSREAYRRQVVQLLSGSGARVEERLRSLDAVSDACDAADM